MEIWDEQKCAKEMKNNLFRGGVYLKLFLYLFFCLPSSFFFFSSLPIVQYLILRFNSFFVSICFCLMVYIYTKKAAQIWPAKLVWGIAGKSATMGAKFCISFLSFSFLYCYFNLVIFLISSNVI